MCQSESSLRELLKDSIEKFGPQWTQPGNIVSNGPYHLKKWIINEYVELELNDKYWDQSAIKIHRVKFFPLSQEAELNRYLAGEIHITNTLSPDQRERINKKIPADIKIHPFFATHTYTFNTSLSKFSDYRVRKALSYAIDRKIITDKILKKSGTPAYWMTPPEGIDFEIPNIPLARLDDQDRIKQAKQFYKAAGYNDGNVLNVEILYNTSELHKRIALAIADMWKKHLNIKVTLNNKEFKSLLNDINNGNFEIARSGWTFLDAEPCLMLELFSGDHPFNHSHYKSKYYDTIYKQACTSISHTSRGKLFSRAEQLLAEDSPVIPLFNQVYIRLVRPVVGGYPKPNEFQNFYIKDLYFRH